MYFVFALITIFLSIFAIVEIFSKTTSYKKMSLLTIKVRCKYDFASHTRHTDAFYPLIIYDFAFTGRPF